RRDAVSAGHRQSRGVLCGAAAGPRRSALTTHVTAKGGRLRAPFFVGAIMGIALRARLPAVFAQIDDHALGASRLLVLTNVTAVQDQPVMRVVNEFRGRELHELA